MISIIIYGRNDSYGYNLHKRAALSINNFAEVLSDPNDEILFVDYNTDGGLPPFPVAIADTLTADALNRLRVFSVTEAMHQSLNVSTHLRTLEPIARNVALKRSNPNNRWILSTNTDMIFVPRGERNLSAVAKGLEDGIYGVPRFELPEGLWESLPRTNPSLVLEKVRDWGERYSLNQITYSHEPHQFDAPGDFQLMLRQDLFDIDGFDESMVLGWHVDSNIAKRLSFLRGSTRDLSEVIAGYHCDHTRVETPMHKAGARANSILKYVDRVRTPDLPSQRGEWGLPQFLVEAQDLSEYNSASTEGILEEASKLMPFAKLSPRRYNADGYDGDEPTDAAITPFLIDFLDSQPAMQRILWVGYSQELVQVLAQILGKRKAQKRFDFHNPLIAKLPPLKNLREYNVIIFDYRSDRFADHGTRIRLITHLNDYLFQLNLYARLKRISKGIRIVGIDVTNKSYSGNFFSQVDCVRTPYSMGFSHGKLSESIGKSFNKFALAKMKKYAKRIILKYSLVSHLGRKFGYGLDRHPPVQSSSDKTAVSMKFHAP